MSGCNVLIVGAGIAGMSAAMHLKRMGVEGVTVMERMSGDRYDRYHRTCGEAVSETAVRLSGIGRGCIVRDVDSIRITCGGVDINIPVEGHIIDRNGLLRAMREESGAEFVQGCVIGVKEAQDGFIVTSTAGEFRCRYLIGADGAFSVVRKGMFGTSPEIRFPAVNNLVEGDSETTVLGFEVSTRYHGAYRWDFPGKQGLRSVGYECGTDDIPDHVERGIRFIVAGSDRTVVKGNCCLVGDAAMLINPICYGGIRAALLSGRKAAEAISSGDLSSYQAWVRKDVMFDRHFLDALMDFRSWEEADYLDSVRPFKGGYSLLRGFYAILRRPRWANVYMSVWMAFRKGW
jgi:digeranylgeranylglycerophospholipid reductase